jgi:multidrug efflux pump
MMTTAALALAVVPLMLAEGAGAAARQAMGLVIFSGLVIGTFFTLFVVPMFYTYIAAKDRVDVHDVDAPQAARAPAE